MPHLRVEPAALVRREVARLPVRGRGQPVGLHGHARLDRVGQRQRAGVVSAHDQQAVWRELAHELAKRGGKGGRRRVTIDVIPVHVGDDAHLQPQPQEHAVVLVRLDDEGAFAGAGRDGRGQQRALRGADGNLSADDEAGIHARAQQHDRDHAGRRGLAVAAGHADAVMPLDERAEKVGALDDRDVRGARGDDLRVVLRHGGRDEHQVCAGDLLRAVPAIHGDPARGQRVGRLVEPLIRAGDREAALQQEAGDGRQARSADADQVDMKCGPRFGRAVQPRGPAGRVCAPRVRACWPVGVGHRCAHFQNRARIKRITSTIRYCHVNTAGGKNRMIAWFSGERSPLRPRSG
ncbi:MAG: hypothetical protein BWY52_03172 [Chloroflexi bacterium ADurb.Bin325]|nr:MAG: hypothetical protein BWY52_03172 [Chloroflexi bacterium ADurb.Bin325]